MTVGPELRREEASLFQIFKTDAIRLTAGWRLGPDTVSSGFCPPAAGLEKTSSGEPNKSREGGRNLWSLVIKNTSNWIF